VIVPRLFFTVLVTLVLLWVLAVLATTSLFGDPTSGSGSGKHPGSRTLTEAP
jgi:hypothetical protein